MTMQKHLFPIWALLLLPWLLPAQQPRRPRVDITVNPQAWADRRANLCIQAMTIPRVGLCLSANFRASEAPQADFLAQSAQWGLQAEARVFPFGAPRPLRWQKKQRREGCAVFTVRRGRERAPKAYLRGLYVAPGFVYQQQDLVFVPRPDLESPVTDFSYRIKSNGGSLALGYQLRFGRLTLGAGWAVTATQPRWRGPVDIFGDSLYTSTHPWKLNIQKGWRLEVGVNF